MIARSASDSRMRPISRSSAGRVARTRSTEVTTSGVGMVARTRWPVSAALMAMSTVAASAMSPRTTTSGSCRSAARRPVARLSVSTPTSRWVMEQLTSRCRNSIGFSMVTTCLCWVRLMWWTIAATVELLPLPLTPVTSTRPRSASAMAPSVSGSPRDSSVGTVNGITRITIMNEERCRSTFTRKRPTPGMPQEQSKSRSRSILARSSSLLISLSAMARVWSGVSRCFVSATSFPLIRARKTSPALMWRSDAPRSTAALMIFSMGTQS